MIARRRLLRLSAAGAVAACTTPQPARAVSWEGELTQGGFVVGRAAPGTRLALDGRPIRVGEDGVFAFGLSRDAPRSVRLDIVHPDGQREAQGLAVAPREWDVQRIDGLPGRMVTPDEQALVRIRAEQARVAELRRLDRPVAHFASGFAWPCRGRISGVYGSQRILNGQPRAPHLGIDIAAPTGTPVMASAAGRVLLAQDMYFNGLTVILDHGHGVQTTYSHLSRFETHEGQEVAQGDTIGLVGATGRVTGPHLDFRINWFTTPVDPIPLLPPV